METVLDANAEEIGRCKGWDRLRGVKYEQGMGLFRVLEKLNLGMVDK